VRLRPRRRMDFREGTGPPWWTSWLHYANQTQRTVRNETVGLTCSARFDGNTRHSRQSLCIGRCATAFRVIEPILTRSYGSASGLDRLKPGSRGEEHEHERGGTRRLGIRGYTGLLLALPVCVLQLS